MFFKPAQHPPSEATMRILVLLCALIFCPVVGFAQDMEQARQTMSQELSLCLGYYTALWAEENKTSPPTQAAKDLQDKMQQVRNAAKEYVPDEGRLGEMGGSAAQVFIFQAMKTGWQGINQEYAARCKLLLDNPEMRFQQFQGD